MSAALNARWHDAGGFRSLERGDCTIWVASKEAHPYRGVYLAATDAPLDVWGNPMGLREAPFDAYRQIGRIVAQPSDPRDPDYSRPGIFAHHNCSRCKNGTDLSRCPTPERPGNCGYPHARND